MADWTLLWTLLYVGAYPHCDCPILGYILVPFPSSVLDSLTYSCAMRDCDVIMQPACRVHSQDGSVFPLPVRR
ncbi:hypothetical protein BDW74DRAFT_163127 [Aspergillus multicolor]|uniref:uncharacterized protein n=1 Tax=Aspergillus multicolor TaxID=41759 RepID=UPI003CCD73CF